MNTIKRVKIARTQLVLDQPFIGVPALQLEILETPGDGTAWTDGKVLGFDPAFVSKQTDAQLKGLVAHEVWHCCLGHPFRRKGRDPEKWNIACDHVVNLMLLSERFSLPEGGLADPQYAGKCAEWIYDRLPDQPKGSKGKGGINAPGAVRDAPKGNADEPGPTEEEWKQTTAQALQMAKAKGLLPANLARLIDQLMTPIVDWRSTLRKYLSIVTASDYTWSVPNRRYLASGIYLPSLRSLACGRFGIGFDTSGSIDQVAANQHASELTAIGQEMQPACLEVVHCDSRKQHVETFMPGDVIKLTPKGGGGTDFRPIFEHFDQDPPVVLIIFTDLMGTFPASAPDYPVIWCSTAVGSAPFGEVIPCLS